IKKEFCLSFKLNKDIMKIFKRLLSLRNNEIWFCNLEINQKIIFNNKKYDLENFSNTSEEYYELLEKSGLINFLKSINNLNLSSLLYGIECGLDSNARKNRTGKRMEEVVEKYFDYYKDKYNLQYEKQVKFSEVYKKYLNKNFDLNSYRNKKFDFVIRENDLIWFVECNFFSSSGSKLDSIAGEFRDLSKYISTDNLRFVWITDGKGWLSARSSFEQSYNEIEHLYTLEDLNNL
ncbi:MAG: type II restriction endonuclease, partial [Malacoplasma sp.]|nr:type II restriction endonuclease [Malacoplasma sp.]